MTAATYSPNRPNRATCSSVKNSTGTTGILPDQPQPQDQDLALPEDPVPLLLKPLSGLYSPGRVGARLNLTTGEAPPPNATA